MHFFQRTSETRCRSVTCQPRNHPPIPNLAKIPQNKKQKRFRHTTPFASASCAMCMSSLVQQLDA
eukprot:4638710-Amphidinium_carterae.2